jgi:hypothetical protein
MVELIENRGIQLGSLCTAHKEESLRITQAVRTFIEQYQLVSSEGTNIYEMFHSFSSLNFRCTRGY